MRTCDLILTNFKKKSDNKYSNEYRVELSSKTNIPSVDYHGLNCFGYLSSGVLQKLVI